MESINIVFATDEAYIKQTCVAIESIMLAAKNEALYHFWIMVESEVKHTISKYMTLINAKYKNCEIDYISMDGFFENVITPIKHITRPTYFRLLLPDMLKSDRCIYLDSDIIVCEDVFELYNISLEGYEVAGVLAPSYQINEASKKVYAQKIDIPSMNSYINAGMIIMNLDLMRKNNFVSKAMKLSTEYLPSSDQDIINKVSFGKIKLLPFRFNFQTSRVKDCESGLIDIFSYKELYEAISQPFIIHYSTRQKPWEFFHIEYAKHWWNICRKSVVYQEFVCEYEKSFFYYSIIMQEKLWKYKQYSKEWFSELKGIENVHVYGAGDFGEKAVACLRENDVFIVEILVSKITDNPLDIQGIEIKEFPGLLNENSFILIATNIDNAVEIQRTLLKSGYFNFYVLDFEAY